MPEIQIASATMTFLENAGRLGKFIEVLAKDADAHKAAIDELETAAISRELPLRFRELAQRMEKYLEVRRLAHEWYCVMEVTFAETFLQDLLADCAAIDPELMADSKQTATYSEIVGAQSLGDLAGELRVRWARNFIDKGGPSTWIERLARMGAREYQHGLAPQLEELWGVRHVVVHQAGRLTADFRRRHPGFAAHVDGRLNLTAQIVLNYMSAVSRFVEGTNRFAVVRYAGRLPTVAYTPPAVA